MPENQAENTSTFHPDDDTSFRSRRGAGEYETESNAPTYRPIKDYALIGDSGSAALVSRSGSIDWLCWPKFDSPSLFGAILDHRKGGNFRIAPAGAYRVKRRYVADTNVLQTTFVTETGKLRLTDLMPVAGRDVYDEEFWPDHEVLRCVECLEGEVDVDVYCDPRPNYGAKQPRLSDRGPIGFVYTSGADVLVLRSDIPLTLSDGRGCLTGSLRLTAGDRRYVSLTYDHGEPAALSLLGGAAAQRIEQSIDYWKRWAARCHYQGPYRDAVVRSALTLKLMTYSRSGAVVAAPTTSLPEKIGGVRNWDYRYCWLRDASLTLRALFELGYREEGTAFFSWLLYTTRLDASSLHVLYDVYGNGELEERTLDHLEGYRGSSPVRIGNQASKQLQLDVYGEVIMAAFEFIRRDGHLDKWQIRLLVEIGNTVCKRWVEPDHGIWEIRSGRRHHTYSKVMCWVALDRLLRMHEDGVLHVPVDKYRREMAAIEEAVEEQGFNERLNSYVSVLGGEDVDASLLLLPVYGYRDARHPRMAHTFEVVQERLALDGLMYRYPHHDDDGLPPGEGAFGLCSFWDEEILARSGKIGQARRHFEQMLSFANDVGLFGEEIDPETGDALGNFPQAFTHIGLINAALTIADAEGSEKAARLEDDVSGEHSN